MMIHVTAQDIADGRRCSQRDCPVARAILRQTGKQCAVCSLQIARPGGLWAMLPREAREFIRAFDSPAYAGDVRPFSFELSDEFLGIRRETA